MRYFQNEKERGTMEEEEEEVEVEFFFFFFWIFPLFFLSIG